MADAQASGACGSNTVWVQVPSPAWKPLEKSRGFLYCVARNENEHERSEYSFSPERTTRKSESTKCGCCDSSMIFERKRNENEHERSEYLVKRGKHELALVQKFVFAE